MIEWPKIKGFQWDTGNKDKNLKKHSVRNEEAEEVFINRPILFLSDTRRDYGEDRLHALGKTNAGRLLHITFVLREGKTLIRVISARDMHKKEKTEYAKRNPSI